MKGLTASQLSLACRTFLTLAYLGDEQRIPPTRRPYFTITDDQPLGPLLGPPVGEEVRGPRGALRGYALRLGSVVYPHLKLQAICDEEDGPCIFMVDTHDELRLTDNHPDAPRWKEIQQANRRLKEAIEREWEAAGLLTFNGLLRRELHRDSEGGRPA